MLDRLFEDPIEKLQRFIKLFFAGATLFEVLGALLYFGSGFIKAIKLNNGDQVALSLILIFVISFMSIILNYLVCLFLYALLNYFQDIHDMKENIEVLTKSSESEEE